MSSSDTMKQRRDEPVAEAEEGYAFDGEQASPASPGLRAMKRDEDGDEFVTGEDRACNVIAVALLFMILITSIISIAAGACCLASLSGKPFHNFSLFFAFGVTPVVVGCLCFVLSLLVIIFIACCAMGLSRYGMCCFGTSRCRGCFRVCLLGVFPFIVFIVLLAMCILGFTFYSLSQQLPPLDKNYTKVTGIYGPIEILRDENGLTHIKASTRRDAYVGQGFASAQDRLFQLEFHRTTALGRLGRLVGNDGATTDQKIRTLNVRDAAYALCNNTSPSDLDFLEAFAEGVNLYMERVSKRPVEFFFMGTKVLFFHDPEPFHAVDVCLTARLFQWQLANNVGPEGNRFAVWAGTNRTYSEVEQLYPDFTTEPNTIMSAAQTQALVGEILAAEPSFGTTDVATVMQTSGQNDAVASMMEGVIYDQLLNVVRTDLQKSAKSSSSKAAPTRLADSAQAVVEESVVRVMQDHFYTDFKKNTQAFAFQFMDASNAWAARDATGHVIVASDPHLTINMPSIWYYNHLSYPDETGVQFDAAGVSMLGVPGVHVGRTNFMAWGITMSKTDLQDLFILPPASFSGLEPRTYYYDGTIRQFAARRERIQVKGKKDIVLDVDDTIFGPIVSSMLGFPASLSVALYATPLLHDDKTSVRALLQMSEYTTDTAEKFMNGIMGLQSPGFSIPIGDINGNIAYAVTGRHPLRSSTSHTGKYPTPAFDAVGILGQICAQATQQAAATDAMGVLTCLNSLTSSGASFDLSSVIPMLPQLFKATSAWKTYPSGDPTITDDRVPQVGNPHVHIAFDSTEAHISACNQKIVPRGYPYFLGADYSIAHRGRRLQELLTANVATLGELETHRKIQMDHRSNVWVNVISPVVASTAFQSLVSSNAKAADWLSRMLAWDGDAPIGSVETAFFWRWMQRMSVLPKDVIAARKLEHSDQNDGYVERMLTSTNARVIAECAAAIGVSLDTADACVRFAAQQFVKQAGESEEKWGKTVNRLASLHEMLSTKIIHPVFQRDMDKGGDFSSLAVSTNEMDGDMQSTHASSMRQLYDLESDYILFMFPGGNSGNPYSKYYQNLWDKFEKETYVQVAINKASLANMTVAHRQTLGA